MIRLSRVDPLIYPRMTTTTTSTETLRAVMRVLKFIIRSPYMDWRVNRVSGLFIGAEVVHPEILSHEADKLRVAGDFFVSVALLNEA